MSDEALSQRKFAELIGRSHVYINKLVKAGKLATDASGKIPIDAGLKAIEASKQPGYEENRAHAERQRQKSNPKSSAKAKGKQAESISIPADDDVLPSTGTVSVDKVAAAFNRARLAEKTYEAKLKELSYKEKQGHLIQKEAVMADAANTAEELRGKLFSIAPRIAPLCEGKTAREIEGLIESEINSALTALKKSRFQERA